MISDAKALEHIYGNPKSKPPMRLERWRLRLQAYDFDVQYKPGHLNMSSSIGDGLGTMTSQNGGQDGRHGSKMADSNSRWRLSQLRVTTSDDPVTRSVSPRWVS